MGEIVKYLLLALIFILCGCNNDHVTYTSKQQTLEWINIGRGISAIKTPEGWLISGYQSLTYVPDQNHEWLKK